MVLSDEEIKKRVVDQLYWDDRVDASKVKVVVDLGTVTLTGTVPSYLARDRAEWDSYDVMDVVSVDNQITVTYPEQWTFPSDSEISRTIEDLIRLNPDLRNEDIRVSVESGFVTLEGSVSAYWKKTTAKRVACGADGVIDLVNRLTVVPTEQLADKAIAREVLSAIERNAYLNIDDLDVEVSNGVVTLSGTVPTWNARRSAEEAAEYTRGVLDVINNLIIRGITGIPRGVC